MVVKIEKPCPCGKIPEKLHIVPGSTCRDAFACGTCCGEWMVEFRKNFERDDSPVAMALAIAAWNGAKRGETK